MLHHAVVRSIALTLVLVGIAGFAVAQPDPGGRVYECFGKCSQHPNIICLGAAQACCCKVGGVHDCVCLLPSSCPQDQDDPCPT